MACERLIRHLDERRVDYELVSHHRVYDAQELAAVEHVSGYDVAKPVMMVVDGTLCMAVVPGPLEVDLEAVRDALSAREVRLAAEDEFEAAFPDCEVGAEPVFGALYGVLTLVDGAVTDRERIVFRAGTHEESVAMATADFLRLVEPSIAEISVPRSVEHRRVRPGGEDEHPEGAWLLT